MFFIIVIPNQHFRKNWARRVKTWFSQPAQKRIRREKRQLKAIAIAPRPAAGPLRPFVHCPTQKYSSKVRLGRGFTLDELKAAGLTAKYAQTVGISVDYRRSNKSQESLDLNANRLKEYKARLVVGVNQTKDIPQLKGAIVAAPAKEPVVSFTKITDELKSQSAYQQLRVARNDARCLGRRLKAKAEKEANKEE